MFPHKPRAQRGEKGLSSPNKAFTNNKPKLAIRDDEEGAEQLKIHHTLRGNIWLEKI